MKEPMHLLMILSWGLAGNDLASGDRAFVLIDYPSAVVAYETALAERPDDPELLWRLARVCVCMGDVADGGNRKELYTKAEGYARRCVAAQPESSHGHAWLAASLGCLAMFEGGRAKVRLSREIKEELDRALELDPANDIAWSVLGSFHRALGNVSWLERQLAALLMGGLPAGGYEEGAAALQKAVALAPDVMRHQVELALLYMECGERKKAIALLKEARKLPVTVASDRKRLRKIESLLKELEPGD